VWTYKQLALEYIHIKYGTYIYKQSLFYLFT